MAYKNLQQFMDTLKERGELATVTAEVDRELEITEIADRISKGYGPALLFENVKGCDFPLLINAMGTYERMALALGVKDLDEAGHSIGDWLDLTTYLGLWGKIKKLPKLPRFATVFPQKVPKGACQDVVDMEPDLDKLPILKCWPDDGGRFMTLPLVMTKDPHTGVQNTGMYRMQQFDKRTTGMHWHLHKDGREIYEAYREIGGKMPVSVAFGCDPAITYAATAPLPKMIDEMMFAGYLRKFPVLMVKSKTNDIYVPAEAEIVLEGYVDVNEPLRLEGPFGDHTGYYSLADHYPVFHVTCITHKKDAVFPATIVGKPPMEDCYLGKATERIFLPLIRMTTPEILDYNFPLEGVFHNCVIVSIKKRFPGHAYKAMNALWGAGQMMYTKMIVIVDADVNPHHIPAVMEAVLKNTRLPRDLFVTPGPLDALDHASDTPHFGNRIGIDATKKWEAEGETLHTEALPLDLSKIPGLGSVRFHVYGFNHGNVLVAAIPKDKPQAVQAFLQTAMDSSQFKGVMVVDASVDPKDASVVCWKLFNNIDAARDIIMRNGTIGIDATKKTPDEGHLRPWPNDIEMSRHIKDLVTRRWTEYGIQGDYPENP